MPRSTSVARPNGKVADSRVMVDARHSAHDAEGDAFLLSGADSGADRQDAGRADRSSAALTAVDARRLAGITDLVAGID